MEYNGFLPTKGWDPTYSVMTTICILDTEASYPLWGSLCSWRRSAQQEESFTHVNQRRTWVRRTSDPADSRRGCGKDAIYGWTPTNAAAADTATPFCCARIGSGKSGGSHHFSIQSTGKVFRMDTGPPQWKLGQDWQWGLVAGL